MATLEENNAATPDAAEVYFSTEDRLNYLIQLKSDTEATFSGKTYSGDIAITELEANADISNQSYTDALIEIDAINGQRTLAYQTIYQFFINDNTSATSIKNRTQDKKLIIDRATFAISIVTYP